MQSITKNAMIIVLPYHKLHYGDCQWPTFALCLYKDCNVTFLDILFNTCSKTKIQTWKGYKHFHKTDINQTWKRHSTDIK